MKGREIVESLMRFKKIIACLLMFVLVAGIGLSAFAAPSGASGNGSGSNHAQLMQFLESEYGAEQASEMLETLQKLGLVDTNGSFLSYPIHLNGKSYTLDEIKQVLADDATDLTQMAEIDGMQISLGMLKQMIDIEDRLSEFADASNTTGVNLTPAHLSSLQSLVAQSGSEGLGFAAANLSAPGEDRGYDDDVIVTVIGYQYKPTTATDSQQQAGTWGDLTITFQLNRSQPRAVTFDYDLLQGSFLTQRPKTNGTVTFQPGETQQTLVLKGWSNAFGEAYDARRNVWSPQEWGGVNFNPNITWVQAQQMFREQVWAGLARAGYIHFHNYKNLDEINFDHWNIENWYKYDYRPFNHTYEGGAYLGYTLAPGKAGLPKYSYLSTPATKDLMPDYFYYGKTGGFGLPRSTMNNYDIREISAQAGSYTTGQLIPMQVTFDNAVVRKGYWPWTYLQDQYTSLSGLQLASGKTALPDIVSYSNDNSYLSKVAMSQIFGFGAIVGKGDKPEDFKVVAAKNFIKGEIYDLPKSNTSAITIPAAANINEMTWGQDFTNQPNITVSYARADAFKAQPLTLDKTTYKIGETATFTVNMYDGDESDWIIDGSLTPEDIGKRLKVSIGNKTSGLIELDWKRGVDGLPVDPPVLEGKLLMTKALMDTLTDGSASVAGTQLRAKIYYNQSPLNDGTNPDDFRLLTSSFVPFAVPAVKYILPGNLRIVYPTKWPSGTSNALTLTDPDATKLGFTYPTDATYTTPDQFEWRSSDETIASIKADGTIIPKRPGAVTFTIVARNNGELATETAVVSQTITIGAGGAAAIVVPGFAYRVYAYQHEAADIVWTTNVMSKYAELAAPGEEPQAANFKLELYDGELNESQLAGQTPLQTWTAPVTAELVNATGFSIPGAYTTNLSTEYKPSYTVRISADNPEYPDVPNPVLSALAYIVVKAAPAVVTLDKKMGQFVTDDIGSLTLNWKLENFDPQNKGDFEFQVTKNGVPIPDSRMTFDSASGTFSNSGATENGGTYRLAIDPVTGTKQIKDVYAITLAAKNKLDSTWSYDSLYLQVYKHDALKIEVDGQAATALKMSNIDRIKNMTSDQIVDLHRDIRLKNDLQINNRDFQDLGAITDQIAWKSGNNDVAGLYFNSNGIVDNIENFQYASYQPKQKLLLSGLANGQTKITATHASTGMKTELDLTVETLKDKLYLFQFYPKAATTITYTNGAGVEESVTSNANGELALYEESGIVSDVYVTSSFNNTTYTGIIDRYMLRTKEGNAANLELYPINILQLRQLAKVEVFFKKPDGKPYTGKVTYRGGVYKNGHYAEETEIGGAGVTTTLGADGKLQLIFDTTKFYSREAGETNAANLSAKDQIEFILEMTFEGDQYTPQLFTFDGNTNPVDMIAFGEKISQLTANPTADKAPLIVSQYVTSGGASQRTYVTNYKGKFGPNNDNPSITLTTELLWWGETVDDTAYAELLNAAGLTPQGQSYETIKYPFSDMYITRHRQVFNKDTIWLKKAESGSVHFKLYSKPGSFRKSFTSASTLVNMIGVVEISAAELQRQLAKLKKDMEATNGSSGKPSNNDKVMLETLELMSGLKLDAGPLSMRVYPTDDPLVYKTVISASLGNMPETQGSSGVDFFKSDNNYAPGAGDMYAMAMGKYLADQQRSLAKLNKESYSDKSVLFHAAGYYTGEIKYNPKTAKWEAVVHGGGFTAGGGFSYTQTWNMMASFVPVTFSLTIGGGLEVDFKASVLFDEKPSNAWKDPTATSVNDYLTSLRIIAYVEAFGGIGFDYSVIAMKIGVFGRVTVENKSTWLNRDYLQDAGQRVLYGNKLALEGVVGIRVVLKFLFISIQHDFASLRYSHSWVFRNWDKIYKYWSDNHPDPLTAANMQFAIAAYMESIGEDPMQVIESQTVEDRSYLDRYTRSWNESAGADEENDGSASSEGARSAMALSAGAGIGALTSAAPAAPDVIQSNAYPYSNPQVAQDGTLLVYLSDGGSAAVENTIASWATRNGSGYLQKGRIATNVAHQGYGDSSLQIAGESNLVAAVWVTQKDRINKAAGEALTNEEMLQMSNSAEIMVGIYNGVGSWKTYQLTSNQHADVAPVVAIKNNKVFVAYRSVNSSNPDNPLDFSGSDSIVYTVFDPITNKWSDTETLYNGTNGTVTGMSAEMLSDGTAAVVYTVNKGDVDGTAAGQDAVAASRNEIIYAVVDTADAGAVGATTWKAKGVVKNLQLTNDSSANENPHITSAKLPDGVERFIIAWHATSEAEGTVTQDVKLAAINGNGEVYTDFVDSLNALNNHQAVKVGPNFTFSKRRSVWDNIDQLSIVWKEADADISPTQVVTRDTLKSVKFGTKDGELYLSGVNTIAVMPDYTEIDTINVYVTDPIRMRAVMLGTTYTTDTQVVGTITPNNGDGDDIPVHVSQTVSGMYTILGTYQNAFEADKTLFNPGEVVAGYDLPVQFQVVNKGVGDIDKIAITIDGQRTEFSDIALAPNSSGTFTASYAVPAAIRDVPYQVEVTFAQVPTVMAAQTLSTSGELKLDIPDVGISQVQVLKEENGKRTLSVPVYNKNDTTLANKGRVVKLGLYRSNLYEASELLGNVVEISDQAELDMIDQGAYVHQLEVDLSDMLSELGQTEIPEKGITLYLRTWVEDASGKTISEFDPTNNETKVTLDNLSVKYNNKNVLLTLDQSNSAAVTSVNLMMQNMNMALVASGNVLLNLLDADGNIMETKYLATDRAQLLSFSAEEKKTAYVQFSQAGDAVQAVFFYDSSDAMDSTLSAVTLAGIPLDFAPAQTTYQLQANDLRKTQLMAVAAGSGSTVTLLDGAGNPIASDQGFVSGNLALTLSEAGAVNEFTVRVEPESTAGTATDYRFEITNTQTERPTLELLVKGTKGTDGKYTGNVELALSPYNVEGFAIDRAQFQVNSGSWSTVAYDGSSEKALTTLSAETSYKVTAKVILSSGLAYELDNVSFEIGSAPVAVAVDPTKSTVTVSKNQVEVDGNDKATITVVLKDSAGNALSGRQVALAASAGSSAAITDLAATTNSSGEARFAVANTVEETVAFTATDVASGTALTAVQVAFVKTPVTPSTPVDVSKSSVTASKAQVEADGNDKATITVVLKDSASNALSGRQVALGANVGSSAAITDVSGTTDASGEARFTVANSVEETVAFTAKDVASGTVLTAVQVAFVKTPPTPGTGTGPGSGSGTDPDPKPEPGDNAGEAWKFFRNGLIAWKETLSSIAANLQSADGDRIQFADTQKHWALEAIHQLVRLHVAKGYADGRFMPDRSITRAEFAAMLDRLFVFASTDAKSIAFADVKGHWAEKSIATLARLGIVKGYQDKTFKPDATITREEMVVILMRLVNMAALPQSGRADFKDLSLAGSYATDSISAAAKAGLIQGYNNTFGPKAEATRAETATLLLKLLLLEPALRELLEQ
ncbi:S-layer homology domain-containing protein [Cohnella soli]|uniref:S-layer homology domain-containing protein n=1 Tax=Cohnella soli TaxID=425005 RepID=A0ABW0HW25_9BACL